MVTRLSRNRREGQRLRRLLIRERELWDAGCLHVAGVDEAGMGPLAGPVVAAAVIFAPGEGLRGVHDSKQVSVARRQALAAEIRERAAACAVVALDVDEIDSMNIYRAGLEAMRRAVLALEIAPQHLLVDARRIPGIAIEQEAIVKGDTICHAIAAASILAKTARDEMMERYDLQYPGYEFATHKGYATAAHRDAIRRLGPSPIHRRSFTLLPQPRLFD